MRHLFTKLGRGVVYGRETSPALNFQNKALSEEKK